MIIQIAKDWEKLFPDPIIVQTTSGATQIQPQRTNNIIEQFLRCFQRANRRQTGNAVSSRMLRTVLAETPLVRNLQNPNSMKILLNGKTAIENVFAEIDIDTLHKEFRKAPIDPEKIPAQFKALIAMPDCSGQLIEIIRKAVA